MATIHSEEELMRIYTETARRNIERIEKNGFPQKAKELRMDLERVNENPYHLRGRIREIKAELKRAGKRPSSTAKLARSAAIAYTQQISQKQAKVVQNAYRIAAEKEWGEKVQKQRDAFNAKERIKYEMEKSKGRKYIQKQFAEPKKPKFKVPSLTKLLYSPDNDIYDLIRKRRAELMEQGIFGEELNTAISQEIIGSP